MKKMALAVLFAGAIGLGSLAPIAAAAPIPTQASGNASYCGLVWGSGAESASSTQANHKTVNIRSGKHDCYDRLVIDMSKSGSVDYDVRYVPTAVHQASGQKLSMSGGAILSIDVKSAGNQGGTPTYSPANPAKAVNVSGYSTFKQVRWGGSFEGQSSVFLGVRAHLPFRTFTLQGPGNSVRLVIDVAHKW